MLSSGRNMFSSLCQVGGCLRVTGFTASTGNLASRSCVPHFSSHVKEQFQPAVEGFMSVSDRAHASWQSPSHHHYIGAGARQVLWGDVHSSKYHFQPLYNFLFKEVVFNPDRRRLDTLPPQPRAKLLAVVAAFLPYYKPVKVSTLVKQCLAFIRAIYSHTTASQAL